MRFRNFTAAALCILATAAATPALAETITLKCGTAAAPMVFIVDPSARTISLDWNGYPQNLTNVAISDGVFSGVLDQAGIVRSSYHIDRTTGSLLIDNYYYPQGGMSGAPEANYPCTKIPDKAF